MAFSTPKINFISTLDLDVNPPTFDIYGKKCYDGTLNVGYASEIAVYRSGTETTVMVGGTISCKIDTVVFVNALGVGVTIPTFSGQSVVENHNGLDLYIIIDGSRHNQ